MQRWNEKIARQFSRAKIPGRYLGSTFSDYIIDEGNTNAVKWAQYTLDNNQSLYFFGSPGTGKTFLASIIAQELLKKGVSVLFSDTPSLLDSLKSTFDKKAESTLEQLMNSLYSVDALILDDLGVEMVTEWAVERLYLIINARYNADKMTIITSNFSLSEVANRFSSKSEITGQRVVSRLKQMCKVAGISGNDKRLIKERR